jgi:hypothetical protein
MDTASRKVGRQCGARREGGAGVHVRKFLCGFSLEALVSTNRFGRRAFGGVIGRRWAGMLALDYAQRPLPSTRRARVAIVNDDGLDAARECHASEVTVRARGRVGVRAQGVAGSGLACLGRTERARKWSPSGPAAQSLCERARSPAGLGGGLGGQREC